MKRTERHHLKDNELARLTASASHLVQERRSQLTAVAAGIIVVLVAAGGYYAWTARTSARAHMLLAEATAVDDASVGPLPAPGSPAPAQVGWTRRRGGDGGARTRAGPGYRWREAMASDRASYSRSDPRLHGRDRAWSTSRPRRS